MSPKTQKEETMEGYTKQLAHFCSTLEYRALPKRVVDKTKWIILDALGNVLGAATLEFGKTMAEYARTPLLLVTSHRGAEINFTLKQIASLYNGEIQSYPDGIPLRIIMRPEVEIDIHLVRGLSPEIDAAIQRAQLQEGMDVAVNDQDNAEMLLRIRGAIGWMTLAQLISENLELTPLPIDNIALTQANFASGKYPLFKTFSVVTGAQPTPLVKAFLKFLFSAEGRAILVRNGHFLDVTQP